jgi:hypothetical protein
LEEKERAEDLRLQEINRKIHEAMQTYHRLQDELKQAHVREISLNDIQ